MDIAFLYHESEESHYASEKLLYKEVGGTSSLCYTRDRLTGVIHI